MFFPSGNTEHPWNQHEARMDHPEQYAEQKLTTERLKADLYAKSSETNPGLVGSVQKFNNFHRKTD